MAIKKVSFGKLKKGQDDVIFDKNMIDSFFYEGITETNTTIPSNFYRITLVALGVSDLGLYLVQRGAVTAIKSNTQGTVSQASDGTITITSNGGNISYMVLRSL